MRILSWVANMLRKSALLICVLVAIALIGSSIYLQWVSWPGILPWELKGPEKGLSEKETYELVNTWGQLTASLLNMAGFFMIMVAFIQQTISNRKADKEHDFQRLEDNFYQLINLHHQNVNLIHQKYIHDKSYQGSPDFFTYTRDHLVKELGDKESYEKLHNAYDRYYVKHRYFIDHFVRHVILTLDYVRESAGLEDSPESRGRFFRILKTQLSSDELWVLFIHLLLKTENDRTPFLKHLHQQDTFFSRIRELPLVAPYWDSFPEAPLTVKQTNPAETYTPSP